MNSLLETGLQKIIWLFVYLLFLLIFSSIGNFSNSQSVLLALGTTYLIYAFDTNQKKIELEILVKWGNLIEHPDFPKDIREKLKKFSNRKSVNKDSFYQKSHTLRFVLNGNGNSAWSDYYKSFSTVRKESHPYYGVDFPRSLTLLIERLSKGLLPESEKEPLFVIEETGGKICFSFVFKGPSHEVRVINLCKFPSHLLYNRFGWFQGKILKGYGFEKLNRWDEPSISNLEFMNAYFTIWVTRI